MTQNSANIIATGSDVLDRIMQHKKQEVAESKIGMSVAGLKEQIEQQASCRGFVASLQRKLACDQSAVIAEIKKASPSKGVIRSDFNPTEIALSYEKGGAACLSVLTDQAFFKGSTTIFKEVRKQTSLAMLRKDFMLDAYQVYQARAMGADCILLIVAALTDDLLVELNQVALALGMDVLVEVHNESELQRGLALGLPMIGINNRNLRNFETSLSITIDLLEMIPNDIVVVTESGIHRKQDIDLMRDHSVNSFLVGEAFMRADDPGVKLAELFF